MTLTPEAIQARLLYRDGMILVLDKPSGYAVHPGPGKGPNLHGWMTHLRFGLPNDPAIAHRLDRDTTGCLALGRHAKAVRLLNALFAAGQVGKTYWAIVHGRPPQDSGTMALPLVRRRSETTYGYHMAIASNGETDAEDATTGFRMLGTDGRSSWLELKPQTGRTHQLRVHCAALGCPIAGDTKYGGPDGYAALHLHARALSIPLDEKKAPIAVEAPLPVAVTDAFAACGYAATPQ